MVVPAYLVLGIYEPLDPNTGPRKPVAALVPDKTNVHSERGLPVPLQWPLHQGISAAPVNELIDPVASSAPPVSEFLVHLSLGP